MSEQKTKLIMSALAAIFTVVLLMGTSYSFFPSQKATNLSPLPSLTATPVQSQETTSEPTPTISSVPLPIPSPIKPGETPSNRTLAPLSLFCTVSSNVNKSRLVAQGETITLNITLTSLSNEEFTIPMYLAIGAFQNQPFHSNIPLIATPPPPYSNQWPSTPSSYQWNDLKPFNVTFEENPVIIKPHEKRILTLQIQAATNATVGKYSLVLGLGNWQQTGLGRATFVLTVFNP